MLLTPDGCLYIIYRICMRIAYAGLVFIYHCRIIRSIVNAELMLSFIFHICRCIAYAGIVFMCHLPRMQMHFISGISV